MRLFSSHPQSLHMLIPRGVGQPAAGRGRFRRIVPTVPDQPANPCLRNGPGRDPAPSVAAPALFVIRTNHLVELHVDIALQQRTADLAELDLDGLTDVFFEVLPRPPVRKRSEAATSLPA